MEGKAVLFKRFADIDVFDIEVSAPSTEAFIETVVNIAPTFGGINLEDIAAPQCFAIEQALRERLEIPVFHDDQHGTAVITCAGLINALELQGKLLEEVEIVIIGAGAAGIATTKLLYRLGVPRSSILLVDSVGVIYSGRDGLNVYKEACAIDTPKRTLAEALVSADVVIGVSGPNLINKAMIRTMARRAIVFALSNPDPEISPTEALAANPNIIMATGRSDFPNQVNNSLVFPFLFRGVLNAGAQQIEDKVLVAAMHALAGLAREPVPDAVLAAYQVDKLEFGPGYILPTQFDPRLYDTLVPAIEAAVDKDQHKGESQSRGKSAK
jgi:malate dehydrogenase (oxaloacetate-decarboxylating)(NADP+)